MAAESLLEIDLLGQFETRIKGRVVPSTAWRQRRAAAVVKLLALEPGHWLHREQLFDVLWPDLEPGNASNNLRGALHHARLALETAGAPPGLFLVREGERLLLGPPNQIVVDVDRFREAASLAWQSDDPAIAEDAAGLYTGELLPEEPYEEWATARREGLRVSFITLMARLAALYEERGALARAFSVHERILVADPFDEAAHACLMRLHARMGNPQLALAQYARLEAILERELGTTPERDTRRLAEEIRTGQFTSDKRVGAPLPFPPPLSPSTATSIAPSARLPVPGDHLVGREREMAELERLLSTSRLVTLTGPGGIGKTRLAQEAARAIQPRFPDGVAFVDLAPLRDPAMVLPTVGQALGVDEAGALPISELLAATVREQRLLLVLDNVEHLTAAAPEMATLLADCPRLAILATSRVRLRLRTEQEYPVLPLALPASRASQPGLPFADLAQVAAIELFTRRATAARPNFTLTDQNIEAVVAICQRLDGLPLAIELAAAQVRVLAPAQLLHRLERPLETLNTAAQDVPERQRTLRAAIAWSYDLLTREEQVLFRRLSVFVGGWSLEGMAAIGDINGGRETSDAIETLGRLVDHSLVTTRCNAGGDELRYTMLETIREFATEQLAVSGEAESAERAFEAFLLSTAKEAEKGLRGPNRLLWLIRLEPEETNVRVAMGRILDRGDGAGALRLALRLWEYWEARGYLREGRHWLERTLALAQSADAGDRAAAEFALGRLTFDLGDYDAAEAHYKVSLEVRRQLGDAFAVAEALSALAKIAVNRLAYDNANDLGEESLQISRRNGDRRGVASALQVLGMIAREQGQYERALDLFAESLALGKELEDTAWTARITSQVGFTYRLAGNAEQAQHFLSVSRRMHSELGDRFALGIVANEQGHIAFDTGHIDRAINLYAEALQIFDEVGGSELFVEAIEWLAVAVAAKGESTPSLRLFGATAEARTALNLPPRLESDEARVRMGLDCAMQAVGPNANAALASGRLLSLDQARDEALRLSAAVAISAEANI